MCQVVNLGMSSVVALWDPTLRVFGVKYIRALALGKGVVGEKRNSHETPPRPFRTDRQCSGCMVPFHQWAELCNYRAPTCLLVMILIFSTSRVQSNCSCCLSAVFETQVSNHRKPQDGYRFKSNRQPEEGRPHVGCDRSPSRHLGTGLEALEERQPPRLRSWTEMTDARYM